MARTTSRPPRERPRSVSRLAWPVIVVLALLLSACELRQEFSFNPDGSGTATGTFAIDKRCVLPGKKCGDEAERLLKGEGPVANARADAESLPFDVRIEPYESPDGKETGYTLSFDFASVADLERKLAVDPATDASQTTPFRFGDITMKEDPDGFVFETVMDLRTHIEGLDAVSFAVVLPGAVRDDNADLVQDDPEGTRFQWDVTTEKAMNLRASTNWEPASAIWPAVAVAIAVGVAVLGVVAIVVMRRRRRGRSVPGGGPDVGPEFEAPASERTRVP